MLCARNTFYVKKKEEEIVTNTQEKKDTHKRNLAMASYSKAIVDAFQSRNHGIEMGEEYTNKRLPRC